MTQSKECSLSVRKAEVSISYTSCPALPTLSLGSLHRVETVMVSTSRGAHEDLRTK